MPLASERSSTTANERGTPSARRRRSASGAVLDPLARALAAPLLRVEQERTIDLHAIAVGERRIRPHELAEHPDRARLCLDARGAQCVAHPRAVRQLQGQAIAPAPPREP